MKNVKLAFSVYALTLALASNGAWAAIGQANPSCEANSFTTTYRYTSNDCKGYSPTSGNSTEISQTWGADFNMLDQSRYGTACLGYELTGWKNDDVLKQQLNYDTETGYVNDDTIWKTFPAPNGTSNFILTPTYIETETEITLNSNGADSNSDPTTIWRRGVQLFLGDDSQQEYMSNSQTPLTSLPQKYGYTFKGYFATPNRATTVGSFWKTGADTYTETYCADTSKMPQSEWAKGDSSTPVMSCAWIKSDGHLGNDFVGTAAAKNGIETLYAAWEPSTFNVIYNKGGVDAGDTGFCSIDGNCITGDTNQAKPSNDNINLMTGVVAGTNYECRYGATEYPQNSAAAAACLPTGDPTTTLDDVYAFAGWSYSISYLAGNGPILVAQSAGIIPTSELKNELPTIIKSHMTENGKTTFNKFSVAITAHWTGANREVNIYPYYGSNAEPLKYYFWVNRGWYKKNDTSLEKVTEFDISQFTAPKAQNGVGTEFRGLALGYDSTKTGDDKSAELTSIVDETSNAFIMPNIQAATRPSGTYMLADKAGEWKSADTTANQKAVSRLFNDVYLNDSSVKIYGTWAQKCNPLNAQSRCNLDISAEGEVTYVNTCDSGYNIDGLSVVNGK